MAAQLLEMILTLQITDDNAVNVYRELLTVFWTLKSATSLQRCCDLIWVLLLTHDHYKLAIAMLRQWQVVFIAATYEYIGSQLVAQVPWSRLREIVLLLYEYDPSDIVLDTAVILFVHHFNLQKLVEDAPWFDNWTEADNWLKNKLGVHREEIAGCYLAQVADGKYDADNQFSFLFTYKEIMNAFRNPRHATSIVCLV